MALQPSDKSYAVAVCLAGIFGVAGIHHFYLGRYLWGVVDFSMLFVAIYLIATGRFWPGMIVVGLDFLHSIFVTIMLLIGEYKDGKGHVVCYPGQRLS